jgi:hypothetical protein
MAHLLAIDLRIGLVKYTLLITLAWGTYGIPKWTDPENARAGFSPRDSVTG